MLFPSTIEKAKLSMRLSLISALQCSHMDCYTLPAQDLAKALTVLAPRQKTRNTGYKEVLNLNSSKFLRFFNLSHLSPHISAIDPGERLLFHSIFLSNFTQIKLVLWLVRTYLCSSMLTCLLYELLVVVDIYNMLLKTMIS